MPRIPPHHTAIAQRLRDTLGALDHLKNEPVPGLAEAIAAVTAVASSLGVRVPAPFPYGWRTRFGSNAPEWRDIPPEIRTMLDYVQDARLRPAVKFDGRRYVPVLLDAATGQISTMVPSGPTLAYDTESEARHRAGLWWLSQDRNPYHVPWWGDVWEVGNDLAVVVETRGALNRVLSNRGDDLWTERVYFEHYVGRAVTKGNGEPSIFGVTASRYQVDGLYMFGTPCVGDFRRARVVDTDNDATAWDLEPLYTFIRREVGWDSLKARIATFTAAGP